MISDDPLEQLRQLDACAVSDALNRLGLEGVIPGPSRLAGDRRIAGRVITVELGAPTEVVPSRHLATAAVLAATPGDVIVVDHQGRVDCAGWGGNLSRAALAKGVSGVVVNGAVRDLDEARELEFPVFATAVTPRTARGRAVELSWGQPITVGGIEVSSGDWLIGDGSGVVVIPADRLGDVLTAAGEIVRHEDQIADALARGVPVDEAMGGSYERMLDR